MADEQLNAVIEALEAASSFFLQEKKTIIAPVVAEIKSKSLCFILNIV